jgi:beta-lactamase regulating signal transducer with metallopeptidase domain/predicted metallopeptidase
MENIFNQNLNYAIGWTVIHSLWQATAIAILSGIVMIILRKKTAQTRYIVHNVALFAVLVSAVITFNLYYSKSDIGTENITNLMTSPPSVLTEPMTKTSFETAESLKITIESTNNQSIITEKQTSNLHLPIVSGSALSIDGMKSYFDENIYVVVLIWLLGVGLFLLKLLGGISYVYYLRNQHNFPVDEYWFETIQNLSKRVNIQKQIDLVESALVRSPVVVGYLKPMILFPIGAINRLNPNEVEAILAHEIAHVMRDDYVFNIVQSVIEALFYFNPAVWWISANIRAERENCCDDVAIELCGNSMTYAKSLVLVQEMQYYSAAFAMGFAGQRKNQLLLRVQRVLNQSNNKSNVMEKLIATCLIVLGFVFLSYGGSTPILPDLSQNETLNELISDTDNDPLSMSGYWNAEIKNESVYVNFQHKSATNNWNSGHTFDKKEFSALPTTESEFTITREAGTMTMKGKFEGNEGYGKFTFTENADFKIFLAQEGIEITKEHDMMMLFMGNINRDYVAFLKQNGYKDISKSRLVELSIHGLTKDVLTSYFSTFDKKDLTLGKLIELKIHGVTAAYKKSLNDAGFIDVPLQQIIEAKIHGVSPEYLADLASSGYKPTSLQEVIEFKIHGVNGDFIKKMKGKTNRDLSNSDIVEAKIHGVDRIDVEKVVQAGVEPTNENLRDFAIHGIDADYIAKMQNAGFGKLSPQQLIEAKIHGITPELVKSYAAMGYADLSFNKVVEFKIHGITSDYAQSMAASGYKGLSANKLTEFKIHGITPQYVKELAEMGFKDLSANKVIECKIHGINASYLKGFADIGFKDLPISRLVEAKIHGITPDFIKGFTDLGFKNVEIQDVINLKIHGVTPQYIQDMRAKGYKNLDLDEYLNLKIQGFSK